MPNPPLGCARPTGSVVGGDAPRPKEASPLSASEPVVRARVGAKAPDFHAPAHLQGKFVTVKLSDYLGKWVLLCFYPGDFTFV